MKFKDGVYKEVVAVQNGREVVLRPSVEIETAMETADALSKAIARKDITITAIFDGKHMIGSKHYSGNAFDMRKTHYTNYQLTTLVQNIKDNLGIDFDIVIEKTHVHIEYDPK